MLRWPDRRAQLERACGDHLFDELCEAYELTCTAAEYWSRSTEPNADRTHEEYRSLITATERDILDMLS